MRQNGKYKVIDLFAGAGGMTLGFHMAGFESKLAVDFDKDSCLTYKKNFKNTKVICDDIGKIDNKTILKLTGGKVDVIIGGPPCQGFSTLGKKLKDDPRNQLWREYLRIVTLLKPKVWVMENVPELLKSQEFAEVKKVTEKLGYHIKSAVLNAADYGVPQRRQRAIVLAARIENGLVHPRPTHTNKPERDLFNPNQKNWVSVREAFEGLSLKPNGKNWHVGRNPSPLSLKRYMTVPPGGNRFDLPKELQPDCWLNKPTGSTDVFGRLWWERPSLTVRTEFYKPEKGRYLHPSENRSITLREGARLQTFPDSFEFVGKQTSVGRQIGNAVPCRLAYKIALAVKKHLDENY